MAVKPNRALYWSRHIMIHDLTELQHHPIDFNGYLRKDNRHWSGKRFTIKIIPFNGISDESLKPFGRLKMTEAIETGGVSSLSAPEVSDYPSGRIDMWPENWRQLPHSLLLLWRLVTEERTLQQDFGRGQKALQCFREIRAVFGTTK